MTTLKLEVGKSYRTRDGGGRVEIIRYDSKNFYNGICYPYRGDNTFTYQEDGLIMNEDIDPDDLISEWQDEPEKEKTRYIMDKHGNISVLGQITVRDYFAGCALQGMIAAGGNGYSNEEQANLAFSKADAMLKARGE